MPRKTQESPTEIRRSARLSKDPAENYERFFVPAIGRPLADELIQQAEIRAGERVLDVACGTGVLTRLAAERVGERGRVAGFDLNSAMLAVARSATPKNFPILWEEGTAESMPFDDSAFDVVLCQLGLQFMQDRAAALREMRRVLVPGGRLALSVAGTAGALFAAAHAPLAEHLGPAAEGFVQVVFSLNDPRELDALIREAGFRDVEVRRESRVLHLPPPRQFLWQYVYATPLALAASEASEERRNALEQDIANRWEKFTEEDGRMRYGQEILVARARR